MRARERVLAVVFLFLEERLDERLDELLDDRLEDRLEDCLPPRLIFFLLVERLVGLRDRALDLVPGCLGLGDRRFGFGLGDRSFRFVLPPSLPSRPCRAMSLASLGGNCW